VPVITVATFNTHTGMDGWGRPFDLVASCRDLAADVLVLEEVFAPRDGLSQADEVAAELGYGVAELPLARSWRRLDPASQGGGWEPRGLSSQRKSLYVGGSATRRHALVGYTEGTWGLAVLSRLPVLSTEVIELGRLRRDVSSRAALAVRLSGGRLVPAGSPAPRDLEVIGVHIGHFSHGSIRHFGALRRALPGPSAPGVLAGDMNLWGPPVELLLGHWRRAARGRTWPARHPHSQLDHIFVTPAVEVLGGEVVRTGDSDHLAVRAKVAWE
jgi:endonuclease/exonuclease/phosphatase family metal-dependent hydrolase